MLPVAWQWVLPGEISNFLMNLPKFFGIITILDCLEHPFSNGGHVLFAQPARRHGWRAQTQTTGSKRRFLIVWYSVFIRCQANIIKGFFGDTAMNAKTTHDIN